MSFIIFAVLKACRLNHIFVENSITDFSLHVAKNNGVFLFTNFLFMILKKSPYFVLNLKFLYKTFVSFIFVKTLHFSYENKIHYCLFLRLLKLSNVVSFHFVM